MATIWPDGEVAVAVSVVDALAYMREEPGRRRAGFLNASFYSVGSDQLLGADFRLCRQTIIDAGHPDGYRFIAVRHDTGMMIRAGCRWLTVDGARRHWRGRKERRSTRAALAYVIEIAKARGWTITARKTRKRKRKAKS